MVGDGAGWLWEMREKAWGQGGGRKRPMRKGDLRKRYR